MTTYYHGGHIGDAIYSLYTIMKNGGGDMVLGPGQKEKWGREQIEALKPLIKYQFYINEVRLGDDSDVDHNFMWVNDEYNKSEFWGWDGRVWPGNCQLKYRYYNTVMRKSMSMVQILGDYKAGETWLTAPDRAYHYDVVFHAPLRKNFNRCQSDWIGILEAFALDGYSIAIIGDCYDIDEWPDSDNYIKIIPSDLLQVGSMLDGCSLFIGLPSCNYVIAEGLGIFRFVDMHLDSESAKPTTSLGWDISKWDSNTVIKRSIDILTQ